MAQKSAMNSANPTEDEMKSRQEGEVKTEVEVKLEVLDCLVCGARSRDCYDVYAQCTAASGASLHAFIAKFTQLDLAFVEACAKSVCKSCFDLINVLERAELEYLKLKETFEGILSKNPLFELAVVPQPIGLSSVKREVALPGDDSEDEPLARQSRGRNSKTVKKKKKLTTSKTKKKKNDKTEWECEECGAAGEDGGEVALTAHKLAVHTLEDTTIKTEDGINNFHSGSPFSNSLEVDIMFEDFDDDDDSNFIPEEFTNGEDKKKEKKVRKKLSTEKKPPKQMLQCDQCDSRYTSQVRLEAHKHKKHDGSKPPYICEVCGAHYKHKRACDIHIALHKGISDWKCEECNKLFPSKNALQRHNNIHTGKLNYQCDLCGKSFIHTSSFKMHKLTHSGVKPHACDVCGLRLMTRSHLKRHKRIHSGEKRHECQVCGKRFSERYNLAAHLKAHEAPDGAPVVRAVPVRRLFRCHFCIERFERRYMLERHMSAIHGRTLERPPPTPRNTMSKLLKQRAQRPPPTPGNQESSDTKEAGSPEARAPLAPSKLLAHLTSSASMITAGSWSGAYAAEFGLRADFPH